MDRKVDLEVALSSIRNAIQETAVACGRRPEDVTLVAASKTVEPDRLQSAIDLGQRVFGENRLEEARSKWPDLLQANPGIKLHMIGPLQSKKARDAVALFDVIQSVDRLSLAAAIAKERDRQGRSPAICIQVNTSYEPQKSGVLPEQADGLISECRDQLGLHVVGLMCIPPAEGEPVDDFRKLASIAQQNGLSVLSMGMSQDFALAISHGATHVRVGSAIFGARKPLSI
ncbi:MAG: YggS family pyridoxal phosphate-dependent enzyme [Burkholderiales bacterium]|uniref:Putative Alanine racemase n=1 Tax=mine drainage metagenome TaxID=410659 RepID=E6PKR7_9ZZZZ|nr:YggS family pyridoxal phosphate-dependent enzyme [Burkholderiales bacterium]